MGKIQSGILGGFSGKVGTVIGSQWKGIDYMRSLPANRRSSNTNAQLEQRAKFALAQRFIQSLDNVVSIGFRDYARRMTARNSAVGYTLKNAVTGELPAIRIEYPLVTLTRGSLPNGGFPVAAPGAAGTIQFNWKNNSGFGKAKADDKAFLIAYCEELNHAVYLIEPARSSMQGILNVPEFAGKQVQTWISFITENGNDMASSLFTGQVVVV